MRPTIYITFVLSVLLFSCQSKVDTPKTESHLENNLLIQGSFFQGANGIFFDAQDRLYVASVVSRFIGVVDTDTGAILDTLDQADGIEGPDDVTIAPDGTLYYTSILTGEVGRIAPDGSSKKQFVSPGVNPVTLSDEGRLFVALDFQGDGLYELDPNLEKEPRLIIKELGWLNAFDFGPDGYLYGPIWSKGQIVKIDVDKGELEVVIDDLQTPAAVKFNSKGELFAIDHKTGIVYQIDLDNHTKKEIASGFIGADNIAFNSKDDLYLANAQDGSILEVMMHGSKRIVIPPSLCNAGDVEYVDGKLLAADLLSLKSISPSNGSIQHTWHHMIGVSGIVGPFTIDHESGKLAMTSWFGNEVQVWDIAKDEAITTSHDYAVPINAILDNGSLIVAELGTTPGAAKVSRKIDDDHEVLMDASKGLIVPSGLAASDGAIYVADYYTGTIYQLTESGKLIDTPKAIVTELVQPEGLQVGPDGRLYIVETGKNVIRAFDLSTGEHEVVVDSVNLGVSGPAGMPPTWKLSDVHFDGEGSIFVTSDVDNTVLKYDLE